MKFFCQFLANGLVALALLNIGCMARSPESETPTPPDSQVTVAPDYRLSDDRKEMEEIRKQVPAEKKIANDELAFILKLFENPNDSTTRIRDRYNTLVRNKRKIFDTDLQKKRKDFNEIEKSDRETFMNDHQKTLKSLRGRKMSSESRRKKIIEQEDKRKVFYQEQRLRRENFESVVKAERANFEDYLRQKNSEFQQELRNFEAQQREAKKQQQ